MRSTSVSVPASVYRLGALADRLGSRRAAGASLSRLIEPDDDQVANDTEAHDSDGGLVVSH